MKKGCIAICEGMRSLPIQTRGGSVSASISIGIAMRDRGDSVAPDQLVALADAALYQSKREGRDRVTVAQAKPRA